MTAEQKFKIASLRKQGFGYSAVAKELGLPKSTVSNYCRANGLAGSLVEEKEKNNLLSEPSGVNTVRAGSLEKQRPTVVPKVTVTFADKPNPEALADALRILLSVR